tara:strand:- start:91 stop:612 length:522 start_codon:yes stop_codon:yes gene_type:complete
MDKNKKEEMKNWLETNISETDKQRIIRQKKDNDKLEEFQNLIKLGKKRSDLELITDSNLQQVVKDLLNRFYELELFMDKTIDRKIRRSAKALSKLIKKTLNEIIKRQSDVNIDFVIVKKKLQEFNLEFERLNNWSETKLKETNQERKKRESEIESAAPYRQRGAPLSPRDKDW